jgi:hypothetical protein
MNFFIALFILSSGQVFGMKKEDTNNGMLFDQFKKNFDSAEEEKKIEYLKSVLSWAKSGKFSLEDQAKELIEKELIDIGPDYLTDSQAFLLYMIISQKFESFYESARKKLEESMKTTYYYGCPPPYAWDALEIVVKEERNKDILKYLIIAETNHSEIPKKAWNLYKKVFLKTNKDEDKKNLIDRESKDINEIFLSRAPSFIKDKLWKIVKSSIELNIKDGNYEILLILGEDICAMSTNNKDFFNEMAEEWQLKKFYFLSEISKESDNKELFPSSIKAFSCIYANYANSENIWKKTAVAQVINLLLEKWGNGDNKDYIKDVSPVLYYEYIKYIIRKCKKQLVVNNLNNEWDLLYFFSGIIGQTEYVNVAEEFIEMIISLRKETKDSEYVQKQTAKIITNACDSILKNKNTSDELKIIIVAWLKTFISQSKSYYFKILSSNVLENNKLNIKKLSKNSLY